MSCLGAFPFPISHPQHLQASLPVPPPVILPPAIGSFQPPRLDGLPGGNLTPRLGNLTPPISLGPWLGPPAVGLQAPQQPFIAGLGQLPRGQPPQMQPYHGAQQQQQQQPFWQQQQMVLTPRQAPSAQLALPEGLQEQQRKLQEFHQSMFGLQPPPSIWQGQEQCGAAMPSKPYQWQAPVSPQPQHQLNRSWSSPPAALQRQEEAAHDWTPRSGVLRGPHFVQLDDPFGLRQPQQQPHQLAQQETQPQPFAGAASGHAGSPPSPPSPAFGVRLASV